MEKLSDSLTDEELVADLKKVLAKNGLEIEDSKLKDLLSAAKNQMDLENISGGSMAGVIKGIGILSGAILGGVASGIIIPKATGISASKDNSTATLAVAGESIAGMTAGAYIGYELSDAVVNFLKKKNILESTKESRHPW